jgi:hypothetical protein
MQSAPLPAAASAGTRERSDGPSKAGKELRGVPRLTSGWLRPKPSHGVSYRDTLYQRPEQVEDNHYRFQNKARAGAAQVAAQRTLTCCREAMSTRPAGRPSSDVRQAASRRCLARPAAKGLFVLAPARRHVSRRCQPGGA